MIHTYTGLPTYQGTNGYSAVRATITLDLTDAAVQSGSFNLSGYGTLGAPDYTGDITSDTVQYSGLDGDGLLSGDQALTSDAISSDSPGCDSDATSGVCTVSGTWRALRVASLTRPRPRRDRPRCSAPACSDRG